MSVPVNTDHEWQPVSGKQKAILRNNMIASAQSTLEVR
jgi:hypothetical protein